MAREPAGESSYELLDLFSGADLAIVRALLSAAATACFALGPHRRGLVQGLPAELPEVIKRTPARLRRIRQL